jgi:hypothetical protein
MQQLPHVPHVRPEGNEHDILLVLTPLSSSFFAATLLYKEMVG